MSQLCFGFVGLFKCKCFKSYNYSNIKKNIISFLLKTRFGHYIEKTPENMLSCICPL